MIDFKTFKKVGDDGEKAILEHPSGHKIHVVKAALSGKLRRQLDQLPLHQNSPDEAVQDPTQFSAEEYQDKSQEIPQPVPGATPQNPQGQQAAPAAQPTIIINNSPQQAHAPQMQQPPPPLHPTDQLRGEPSGPEQGLATGPVGYSPEGIPTSGAIPSPEGMKNQAEASQNEALAQAPGYKENMASAQGQMQAVQAHAAATAKLQQQAAATEQAEAAKSQAIMQSMAADIHSVSDDIAKGHINPDQYMDKLGTGGKISTAIGLILGGIGGGMTGQPNPVLGYLQKQIDNDIEAQKADMGNKHNLLGALEKQYGNTVVAANMMGAIRSKVLLDQLGAENAKLQGGLATPSYMAATGAIKAQASDFLNKAHGAMLQHEAQFGGGQGGEGQPGQPQAANPDTAVQQYLAWANVNDKEGAKDVRSRYIPTLGVATTPLTEKDHDFVQKRMELKDMITRAKDLMTKSQAEGPIGFKWGTDDYKKAATLMKDIQVRMGEFANLSRFTPEENKIYKELTPDLKGMHWTNEDAVKIQNLERMTNDAFNSFVKFKGFSNAPKAMGRPLEEKMEYKRDAAGSVKPYRKGSNGKDIVVGD